MALGSYKRAADKGRKAANTSKDSAETIVTKGYPKEMVVHFLTQLKPLQDGCNDALDKWSASSKLDLKDYTPEDIDKLRTEVEANTASVEQILKDSDTVRKEIARIAK